ncbi:MAG: serine/threonine-protein kinase [Planctomycetota bacterium]
MVVSPEGTPGRVLVRRAPPSTRAQVEAVLALESRPDALTPAASALVALAEHELSRLLLEPLRPWGDALAAVLEEKKSGRRAADTLRLWAAGTPHGVVVTASQVFQALRAGFRAKDPRVTTLVEVFYDEALRRQLASPELGLALERVRTRHRDPLARDPSASLRPADYEDLALQLLGARGVATWLELGPEPGVCGLIDALLRGTRLTEAQPDAIEETALEAHASTPSPHDWGLVTQPPPRRLGRYELLGELGRGGMGVVYRARDPGPASGAEVAIKLLAGAAEGCPEARQRFGREARAAARLTHEHIVRVLEVGEHDHDPYLVMQLVSGRTLREWLEEGPPQAEVLRALARVADALHYAHEQGVVHRDVNPSNVMIDAAGSPVLMDFGLALDLGARTRLTATGQIMGTPRYMAPEQVEGEPGTIGPASDVYSLGAVLYRALCGRAPFEAGSPTALFKQILLDPPAPPRAWNPALSPELEAVVLRCLEKRPPERYATAWELREALARTPEWEAGEERAEPP